MWREDERVHPTPFDRAFERSPALEPWLRNWAEMGQVEHQFDILKPEG